MTQVDWKTLLPLRVGAERQWSLSLVPDAGTERTDAESFIRERFSDCHRANVSRFMPELFVLQDRRGRSCAAAGLRLGGVAPLFLERYLQEPVESAISRLMGRSIDRSGIVEVGNLAAKSAGSARVIIVAMTSLLATRGLEWVVFTGTTTLVNSFRRLGLDPVEVCAADPGRLGRERHLWGNYYAQSPKVFAGDIRFGRDVLEQNGCLSPHAA